MIFFYEGIPVCIRYSLKCFQLITLDSKELNGMSLTLRTLLYLCVLCGQMDPFSNPLCRLTYYSEINNHINRYCFSYQFCNFIIK